MPVLNEERHLAETVGGILSQDWTGPMEIVLVLGASTDRTNEIARRLSALDERILLITSPGGRPASALNAAIAVIRHDVVVRVDGHALLPTDYISAAVGALQRTGADTVGGVLHAEGLTPFERAVASAMNSRWTVGVESFRSSGPAGEAESVYLGCFRREALERVGGYDEDYLQAPDWEINDRIRQSGGSVWFDPRIVVTYRPRPDVQGLARQYFHFGQWRREAIRRHPQQATGMTGVRNVAPAAAIALVAAGTLAGVAGALGGPRALRRGWWAPVGYLAAITAAAVGLGRDQPSSVRVELPLVLATMHGSWGVGFLSGPAPRRGSD